jgi:hypothetical protein
MKHLINTNKEYLISAGIGIIGLVLSLFVGIFSGNSISTVIFRAFITAILLAIVSFASLFIIKKFVPEIYLIINSISNIENADINVENSTVKVDKKVDSNDNENANPVNPEESSSTIQDETLAVNQEDTKLEREFSNIENRIDDYSSLDADDKVPGMNSRDFFKDRKIKYEPKIAAQAIRTMMKRDE